MILHVKNVKYLHDYVLEIEFNDGVKGEIDLENELEGEIFGPLRDKKMFKTVKVDSLMQTIVWDNGADLAPEFLYDNLQIFYKEKRNEALLRKKRKLKRSMDLRLKKNYA